MIIFIIFGIIIVIFLSIDWLQKRSNKNSYSSTPKFRNTMSNKPELKALVYKAISKSSVINLSRITPYYFDQLNGEKMNFDSEVFINIDYSIKKVMLSWNIAMVTAIDTTMLINSEEEFNDILLINLSPVDYPHSIGASIMISDDKIIVVDSSEGMYVKIIYNSNWVIETIN